MAEKKKQNLVVETGKAVIRGASRGGGAIGSAFGAVQSGINTYGNIKRGFQTYNKKQEKAQKAQAKPKPAPKPAPAKKPAPTPKPAQVKKPTIKKK